MTEKQNTTAVFVSEGIRDLAQKDRDFAAFLFGALRKHYGGNKGDLDLCDEREKELYLANCDRMVSAYFYKAGKIWMVTESDRSVTIVLLPREHIKSSSIGVL
jgi:hypothetical protein